MIKQELERWKHFSEGAVGPIGAMLTLFLATVNHEIRDDLQKRILNDAEREETT